MVSRRMACTTPFVIPAIRAIPKRSESARHSYVFSVVGTSRCDVRAACSAGFPACGFKELSSSVGFLGLRELGTGNSPEPADKNVCATGLNRYDLVSSDSAVRYAAFIVNGCYNSLNLH